MKIMVKARGEHGEALARTGLEIHVSPPFMVEG